MAVRAGRHDEMMLLGIGQRKIVMAVMAGVEVEHLDASRYSAGAGVHFCGTGVPARAVHRLRGIAGQRPPDPRA